MKNRNAAATGLLSLSMLFGGPVVSVFAAEPAPAVAPQVQTMTRGDFLLLLDKAVDLPDTAVHSQYKGIPTGSALSNVVDKMRANGVIAGNSDTIRPNEPITQIEAVTFVSRALGIPNTAVPGGTAELPKSHWAYGTATWLSAAGVSIDWKRSDSVLTKPEAEALLTQLLKTSPEAKQKLEQSQKAQAAVKSFRMNGTMTMQAKFDERVLVSLPAEVRKEMEALNEPLKAQIAAAFSLPDKIKMETTMQLSQLLSGMPTDVKMEQYIIGHDMYMKMNMPEMPTDTNNPSGWVKAPNAFPLDMKAMMEQQMQGIPPQLEKKLFYYVTKDNQLGFVGRIDKVSELASMLQGIQGVGATEMNGMLTGADEVIRSIYMQGIMKLDEKTQVPITSGTQVVISFKSQPDMPIKQLIVTQDMAYSDYDADVKIELPTEAKNAQVIPSVDEKQSTTSENK